MLPDPGQEPFDEDHREQNRNAVESAWGESPLEPGNPVPPESVRATDTERSDQPTPVAAGPKWLHPSSLLFDLISHFRQLLIPAGIAVLSAAQGSWTGILFAIVLFVPAILFSVFRYFTLRYLIADGELVIRQGLFFRRLRKIPLNRIQNIDLIQNPLHRLLGVAEVRIETASGKAAEATLRVLSMRQVATLRSEIFSHDPKRTTDNSLPLSESNAAGMVGDHPVTGSAVAATGDSGLPLAGSALPGKSFADGQTLLAIESGWLVRAGLASNRGMLLIGIVAGLFYQYDLESKLNLRQLLDSLPVLDGSLLNFLLVSSGVLGILLILRLFGVVWYILRFYGYRLTRYGEDLRISCGLFTKVSATIPRKRIQFVSIHRTLIMRWMNLAAVRVETAGGGGGQADNASTMVSRRWFVPVIAEDLVPALINELRPGMEWNEQKLDWRPLAANARTRMLRISVIQSLIVAAIGLAITRPWGWLAGLILAPLFVAWANKKSRAMRYCRVDDSVLYRSGILNHKTSVTFLDKIQTARFDQSPFDRRWQQATLTVDTASAGPAEHRIAIPYLDAEFAQSEYRWISRQAAQNQPDFA